MSVNYLSMLGLQLNHVSKRDPWNPTKPEISEILSYHILGHAALEVISEAI